MLIEKSNQIIQPAKVGFFHNMSRLMRGKDQSNKAQENSKKIGSELSVRSPIYEKAHALKI